MSICWTDPCSCYGAAPHRVAFGVTDEAVRIQGQDLAGEVAAGLAQLAQTKLELLSLRDRVGVQQVRQGAIGGQPWQALGQSKAPVPQQAIGAAIERRTLRKLSGKWGWRSFCATASGEASGLRNR
jgi:hypothetical protein